MMSLRERAWLWRLQRWITERDVAHPQPLPSLQLRAIDREAFDEVDPFDVVGPGQPFEPPPAPPVR
jgi:hypothetical protein